jgi:hypothetical protein
MAIPLQMEFFLKQLVAATRARMTGKSECAYEGVDLES